MKKMRMFTALVLVLVLAFSAFTGCGKQEAPAATTPAGKMFEKFKTEIKDNTDIEAVANALVSDEELFPFAPMVMEVEPGYLNGFNDEISGFNKGVMFGPMIGSIPFVGYIFEADDAKALAETLKESGQLNWNICTVADEMLCETEGNYVFFVMSPNDFSDN